MRWIRDDTGRFPRRPYWEQSELDARCEAIVADFLRERRGTVDYPITTDELTVLLERYAELDATADLSAEGEDVQGVTILGPTPLVRISESLWEPRRENRLRTTLTHELGHVIFHADLVTAHDPRQLTFLGSGSPTADPRCTRQTILRAPTVDWMEWQAGYACGAFLMPASAVRAVVTALLPPTAWPASPGHAHSLVGAVMERFAVSAEAAQVRLERLGYLRGEPAFMF